MVSETLNYFFFLLMIFFKFSTMNVYSRIFSNIDFSFKSIHVGLLLTNSKVNFFPSFKNTKKTVIQKLNK